MCYPNKYNTGYALATYNKEKPKTFEAIQQALIPEDNPFFTINNDLIYWISQGMFLYNYQTTSHLINETLTKEVIRVLNKKENFYWIVLGTEIFYLKDLINPKHFVNLEPHPVEYLRNKEQFPATSFKTFQKLTNFKFS